MKHFVACGALALVLTGATLAQTVEAPLQIGGDVKAPKVLKHPDAHAPEKSGWGEETGECMISIVIDEKGHIARTELTKSSGSAESDGNALQAAQNYLFEPATRHGKPVAVQISISMNYRSHRIR